MESGLYNEFYDEERVLLEALKEVKRLKKEGKSINLEQVLKTKKQVKKRSRKPKEQPINQKLGQKIKAEPSPLKNASVINFEEKGA